VAKSLIGSECRLGMVSGVGRGMGVLDGGGLMVEIVKGEAAVLGVKVGHPSHCNQWELCGVVILCREGLQRGSSQITLGFRQ